MLNLQFVLALELIEGQEWLWNPENIKEANKDAKTYVEVHNRAPSFVLRSYTMHELRNQHVSIG